MKTATVTISNGYWTIRYRGRVLAEVYGWVAGVDWCQRHGFTRVKGWDRVSGEEFTVKI